MNMARKFVQARNKVDATQFRLDELYSQHLHVVEYMEWELEEAKRNRELLKWPDDRSTIEFLSGKIATLEHLIPIVKGDEAVNAADELPSLPIETPRT